MSVTRDQRLGEYRGWLLCAASVSTAGQEVQTPIACRRRPNRRPCPGRMLVMLTEVPERVRWRCSLCGDAGGVDGWRDDVWNLREWMDGALGGEEVRGCTVSALDYAVLRECIAGPALAVAAAQPWRQDTVILRGDDAAFEDLLAAIAEVPDDRLTAKKARDLARVRETVERACWPRPAGRGRGGAES